MVSVQTIRSLTVGGRRVTGVLWIKVMWKKIAGMKYAEKTNDVTFPSSSILGGELSSDKN